MDPITQQTVLAAAGAGGDPVYVDDVFSTFLYDGTGSAQTITNGIDISGEGALVWIKNRESSSQDHALFDTERGAGQTLNSASSGAQFLSNARLSAFNSNGFTVGTDSGTNQSGNDIVSWTFRKQKGFFDVVTYTGTDSTQTTQTIAHSLGSVPGMIIVKRTSGSQSWYVYHRSIGNDKHLTLNSANAQAGSAAWNDTTPTSTHFTVSGGDVNGNGQTHVAYIFAHDDAQFGTGGDESIIKCGSYTGNGGTTNVNLGFEPQWLLVKSASGGYNWVMLDNMRGISTGSNEKFLSANSSDEEQSQPMLDLTPTGFVTTSNANTNANGHTIIYIAIRRPNKPPEVGTNVFAMDTFDGTPLPTYYSGFPVDFYIRKETNANGVWPVNTRLLGNTKLILPADYAEASDSGAGFDQNDGVRHQTGTLTAWQAWMFKRAPGFMDVVTSTGNDATTRNLAHNLTVVPEFIIGKVRNASSWWETYHKDVGPNYSTRLNSSNAPYGPTNSGAWANTTPTASVFTVSSAMNYGPTLSGGTAYTYIFYLFATSPGISKVGSYSGNGGTQNIDCGFTNGARFILIKRKTGGSGDWYVFDTLRGIVSGNDPYLLLNSTAAQNGNYDAIDPLSSGFTLASGSSYIDGLNASGSTYLFFAIA